MSEPPRNGLSARDVKELMTEGFGRVEAQLSSIQNQLQSMPREYVSRYEFDRYRDEQVIEITAAVNRHDRDIESVKTEIRDVRLTQKDKTDKGFTVRIALGTAGVALIVGLPGAIYAAAHIFH